MSRGGDGADIVGINWGSSAFRAYRIGGDGALVDVHEAAAGVTTLDRAGMAALGDTIAARWPDVAAVYAAGMIGSAVGWVEAPYVDAPADGAALAANVLPARIGGLAVGIVPGIACRRTLDDAPDLLRGEEIELLGLRALDHGDGIAAMPGTHTKWVRLGEDGVGEFLTSLSGELFDRMTAAGLLAAIVEGEAADGDAFREGVAAGHARALGLGTLLFGARARVVRGLMARADAASYLRGLLIGAELADAAAALGAFGDRAVPLVGNRPLSALYAAALATIGVESRWIDSRDACLAGFRALHANVAA